MGAAEVDADPLARLAVLLSTRPAELGAAVRLAAGRDLDAALDSPDRLRALVVPIHLRQRAPGPAPDPTDGLDPDLAAVVGRVDALGRFDRAVLVLVAVEHLTRAEVAGLVDRSVATVDQAYERALAATGADPYAVDAALSALAWRGIASAEIRRAEQGLARRRRSRSLRRSLVVAAAVLVAGALVVPGLVRQATVPPAWVRGPREWVLAYQLVPPEGWTVESRTVRADVELTTLADAGADPGRCQIVIDQRISAEGATGSRSVRVAGRPGKITLGNDRADLSWTLAPAATAAISCSAVSDPADFVVDLAEKMIFVAEPIPLAYRLGPLPAGFHVDQITLRPPQRTTVVELWPDETNQASPPISVRQSVGGSSGTEPPELDGAGEQVTLSCRLENAISVCASVAGPGAVDSPSEQAKITQRLRMITENATLAESGPDRAGWFNARDALPRA